MPPKFTLQTVLDVRHNRVEALEIELSKLLIRLREAEVDLRLEVERREDLFQRLEKEMGGEMDLFAIQYLRFDLKQALNRIEELALEIQDVNRLIEWKRQEIVAARQAEETLEILKEKERVRFVEEQDRRDARFQDDLYIAQAFRQREAGIF